MAKGSRPRRRRLVVLLVLAAAGWLVWSRRVRTDATATGRPALPVRLATPMQGQASSRPAATPQAARDRPVAAQAERAAAPESAAAAGPEPATAVAGPEPAATGAEPGVAVTPEPVPVAPISVEPGPVAPVPAEPVAGVVAAEAGPVAEPGPVPPVEVPEPVSAVADSPGEAIAPNQTAGFVKESIMAAVGDRHLDQSTPFADVVDAEVAADVNAAVELGVPDLATELSISIRETAGQWPESKTEGARPSPTPRRRKPAATSAPAPVAAAGPTAAAVPEPVPGAAAPLPDGAAPGPEYTIKGNADSMLFHPPSSPYYERTKAEVWFRTAQDARAAGFTEWTPRRRAAN